MDLRSFRILTLIAPQPLRAAETLDRLRAAAEVEPPSIPSFYRMLKQLLDEGLLEIEQTLSDGGRGRPQHLYRVTEDGYRALRREAERFQVLAALVLDPHSASGE